MTMIVCTWRGAFAVLGAETLHGRQGGPATYHTKVVRHPSLPLAFAVGGCMWWPLTSRHATATDHLAEFAARIASPDELVVKDIADKVQAIVQPGMEHMKDKTQVFIALVRGGKASVGIQQVSASVISDDPTRFWDTCEPLLPRSIRHFFDQERLADVLHDPSITDPELVGERARSIIRRCIDHERTLTPSGENEVIGGGIEVVLVTAGGTRLLT